MKRHVRVHHTAYIWNLPNTGRVWTSSDSPGGASGQSGRRSAYRIPDKSLCALNIHHNRKLTYNVIMRPYKVHSRENTRIMFRLEMRHTAEFAIAPFIWTLRKWRLRSDFSLKPWWQKLQTWSRRFSWMRMCTFNWWTVTTAAIRTRTMYIRVHVEGFYCVYVL